MTELNEFSVIVEARAPEGAPPLDLDEDRIDELTALLQDHAATVTAAADRWGAVVSVHADYVGRAVGRALAAVRWAGQRAAMPDWPITEIRAVRTDVLDVENATSTLPDLVSGNEAAEILGVTRQRVHQLAHEHRDFPEPAYRLGVGSLWFRSAVEQFGRTWERRTGRPPKASAAGGKAAAAGSHSVSNPGGTEHTTHDTSGRRRKTARSGAQKEA